MNYSKTTLILTKNHPLYTIDNNAQKVYNPAIGMPIEIFL